MDRALSVEGVCLSGARVRPLLVQMNSMNNVVRRVVIGSTHIIRRGYRPENPYP